MGSLPPAEPAKPPTPGQDVAHLRDLSAQQWKSGIAAWLGWLFDGLDMHLYVLVAVPFVAELLATDQKDPRVGHFASWIQAAFLIGWALGGGFFGRIADRLGRSRALTLTILTYALFTGLSFFAQTWWQLLLFRFLAALGIGGEWAVGAALLSETWPRRWGPWLAAILQTGVNLGVMLAGLANFLLAAYPSRTLFLVGVLPAFVVLWIRWAVPETEEWQGAKRLSASVAPGFLELFRGPVRRTTLLTLIVCSLALTAHWAFLFWYMQHLRNLPELSGWTGSEKARMISLALWLVTLASIGGNFLAALLARALNYRRAIACLCLAYCLAMTTTYGLRLGPAQLACGLTAIGLCMGVFALFTMYLPPLFPTLLRTTGAGFCYNIGRIAAGLGTVFFGLFSDVGDYRQALFYAGLLFLPAAVVAWALPEALTDPKEALVDRLEVLTRNDRPFVDELAPGVLVRLMATGALGAQGLTTALASFRSGAELPYHTHPVSEVIVVLEGEATVAVEGRRYPLGLLDALHLPAGTAHAVSNLSGGPALLHSSFAADVPTRNLVSAAFSARDMDAPGPDCPERLVRFAAAPVYELAPRAFFRDLFNGRLGARGICGGYGLFEPGASLPCHYHTFDESITIVAGAAVCQVAGREQEVSGYDTVCVPRGRPHRFLNRSAGPMAMVWVYAGDEPERTLVEAGYCEGLLPLAGLAAG